MATPQYERQGKITYQKIFETNSYHSSHTYVLPEISPGLHNNSIPLDQPDLLPREMFSVFGNLFP